MSQNGDPTPPENFKGPSWSMIHGPFKYKKTRRYDLLNFPKTSLTSLYLSTFCKSTFSPS